jgi:hypothetical protein
MSIEYMKYLNLIIIVTVIPILAGILNINSSEVFVLNLTTNSSLNNYQESQTFTH